MDWLTQFVQTNEIPLLTAFSLGLLTAVSPCPLATNITATAYISKDLKSKKSVLWSGFLYTLGRAISYSTIGLFLFWGASKFHIARFFQSKGELLLIPVLLVIGLVMLNVIKLNFLSKGNFTHRMSEKFKDKGHIGSLILGILFALAFCPYSGALYFGMLIPMSIANADGLYLPIVFALGTGLPVMIFSFLLAYSASKVSQAFNAVQKVEIVMRYSAGVVFLLSAIYYAMIYLGFMN